MFSYRSCMIFAFSFVYDPSKINFYVWCKIGVGVQSYKNLVFFIASGLLAKINCKYLVVSLSFIKMSFLSELLWWFYKWVISVLLLVPWSIHQQIGRRRLIFVHLVIFVHLGLHLHLFFVYGSNKNII